MPNSNKVLNSFLYPNPTTSYFRLKSDNNIQNVSLYDLGGKIIKEYPYGQTEYDISDLSKGVYMVKIINAEGFEELQKLVVY